MSEQEPVQTATPVQETLASACPHPEAVGTRWGDPISEERQAELQGILDAWNEASADHGQRRGPFDNGPDMPSVVLTGADTFWLAEQSRRTKYGWVPNLHLEGASLDTAHLEGANLEAAHLEEAYLGDAHLEWASLNEAHLEGAYLDAHLEEATLNEAHLEGALLIDAHLEGADLSGAWLDSKTMLSKVTIDRETRLGDIHWNGVGTVDLTRARWDQVSMLGDEQEVIGRTSDSAVVSSGRAVVVRGVSASTHERAARAYRQLAAQLQAQGMSEVADRFLYRAQICQRRLLRTQRKFGGYLFSLLLAVLAGYGYRLGRIIVAYALIVGVFAAAFLASDVVSGQAALSVPQALDALQISLNAVHGRVFFAQFHLDTLQSWLATVESIVGIVIEGVFVAMLIQRFFGR